MLRQIFNSLLLTLSAWLLPVTAFAAPPPPESFGTLPLIYDAAISPDGRQVAMVFNNSGNYIIRINQTTDLSAKPKAFGLEDGIKPNYIKWVNNQKIIFSFRQSKIFNKVPITMGYLYLIDSKDWSSRILVEPPSSGRRTGTRFSGGSIFRQSNNTVVDWLENDPDHILMAYSDQDNNNEKPDLRKVNLDTSFSLVVETGRPNLQYWVTDQRGEARVGQGRKDNQNADWVLRIRDKDSDVWQDSSKFPNLESDVDIHGFTSQPDEMIISDYQGKDTAGLYVYDLNAKKITRKIYHNDYYDATGLIYSNDGNEIIGAQYTADASEVEMFGNNETVLQGLRRKYDGYAIDYVDHADETGNVLFKVSSPYDPGLLMMTQANGAEPQALSFMRPSLPTEKMGEVISVKYTARDGQKIPAYMTIPPTIKDTSQLKNVPFIVLPHGGPYSRDSKRFDYFAQFFASRGYGVLQMNFRGSEGYGKAYEEAGRKNWVVMQDDVLDGTKWLIEKGYANPDKVCIAGWSYGGYAALMGAAKNPELYNCAISMAGVTDLKDLMRDMRKYRFGKQMAKSFIGAGFKGSDDIKANSPVKIAQDMTVPLFLAHGELDQAVHFDQFKRMKRALKSSKAKVTYMEFKNEDHYLSNEENRKKFFKGLDKFLSDNNGKSEFEPK